jgi:hypothetical protein
MKTTFRFLQQTISKNIRLAFALGTFLLIASAATSCSSSEEDIAIPVNELSGLTKIQEFSNDTHTIELYSTTGTFTQGYNAVWVRLKNTATGLYEKNADITFVPLMHMAMMTHSCPVSAVTKSVGKQTLYQGNIVFQMAQNDSEYWELQIGYTIDGTDHIASATISVPASDRQCVTSFTGSDGVRYIIALVDPKTPRVATNDMTVGLYKMDSMMAFSIVDNFRIQIDPRMPGMGNHGSPNNTDLLQSASDKLYHGKLSLTMTGYWRINLQLRNAANELLKGEAVTAENPQSSLYLETEF